MSNRAQDTSKQFSRGSISAVAYRWRELPVKTCFSLSTAVPLGSIPYPGKGDSTSLSVHILFPAAHFNSVQKIIDMFIHIIKQWIKNAVLNRKIHGSKTTLKKLVLLIKSSLETSFESSNRCFCVFYYFVISSYQPIKKQNTGDDDIYNVIGFIIRWVMQWWLWIFLTVTVDNSLYTVCHDLT